MYVKTEDLFEYIDNRIKEYKWQYKRGMISLKELQAISKPLLLVKEYSAKISENF